MVFIKTACMLMYERVSRASIEPKLENNILRIRITLKYDGRMGMVRVVQSFLCTSVKPQLRAIKTPLSLDIVSRVVSGRGVGD